MPKAIKLEDRNRQIADLYKKEVTIPEIAKKYNISKQRVSMIIKEEILPSDLAKIRQKRRDRKLFEKKKSFIRMLKARHDLTYDQYLKQRRDTYSGKKWAIFHDECVDCGSRQHKHHVDGRCVKCSVIYYKDRPSVIESQRKSSKKYLSKKENREKMKERSKLYYYENRGRLLKKNKKKNDKNNHTR